MRISLIVAVAANNIIGRNGVMPWRMSSDLKHFRALTLGKPVVMGRKTFQSIGKPLDGRDTIVITRDASFSPAGVLIATTVDAALSLAHTAAKARHVDEIMIIGGGEIYRALLPRADRVYLTHIKASPEGDATFLALPTADWREIDRQPMVQSLKDDFPAEFIVYDRQRS